MGLRRKPADAASTSRRGGVEVVVDGLSHSYAFGSSRVQVLTNASCIVPEGGYAAIRGASGAGKSTLLSVLGGLEPVQSGDIRIKGVSLREMSRNDLARYRRDVVGFVFQHFGLLGDLTALENVELALTLEGLSQKDRRRIARNLLTDVGLSHRLDHFTNHLSGGERQRVAIARALANQPAVVFADEPTGNLDGQSADMVMELLELVREVLGCTLVVVTHSGDVAGRADQQLLISDGRIHDVTGQAAGS